MDLKSLRAGIKKRGAERLQELTQPTGEEALLNVDYPTPRFRVPVWQAVVVAVTLIAGVLAYTGLRGGAVPQAPHAPVQVAPAAVRASAAVNTAAPAAEIVVAVVGEVEHPGLLTLPAGARVADAVALAQPRPAANLLEINQAAKLTDGQQIIILATGQSPPPAVGASNPAHGGSSTGRINLNTATAQQLTALHGVGQATAEAIIAHRESIGGFKDTKQLMDVAGIGAAKFAQLAKQVTL